MNLIWCWHSREEELQDLPHHAVSQERGLVCLADGAQEAALAIQSKVEQKVLRVLKQKWINSWKCHIINLEVLSR